MIGRLTRIGRVLGIVALAAALAAPADARVGGGIGSGSRGSRTFSAPAPTATAPRSAQPMQRTETPNLGPQNPGLGAPATPGRFGFGTGMMAGLLGAGLLGAVLGHGFFGGLSGITSLFGLLFQIALIAGLVWLVLRFFRRRSEPAFAGPSYGRSALGAAPMGGGGGSGPRPQQVPVTIGQADYAAFERLLVGIQAAYGAEDLNALTRLATPEMVRYFGSDLEANRSRGLKNEVSGAKLLQGDLAEAWREGEAEYATVAMRFSLVDVMVERVTGKVVQGDRGRPEEATELWTFVRRGSAGGWVLSAIQQAA